MSSMQNPNALQRLHRSAEGRTRREQGGGSVVELMTAIWKRVLNRSHIGSEENFFALGGDPAKATELFAEIARQWGLEMASSVIYRTPTVAALASTVENVNPCAFPSLFPLKTSGTLPPVFLAPGLGGNLMEFFGLLNRLGSERQIYGLEALGADGTEVPFKSVEEMARTYLDSIRSVQPKGPYLLIGHSLGGLVMLEVAQRLLSMGESIALLAMLDSYPHPRFLSVRERMRLVGARATYHASILSQMTIREAVSYVISSAERVKYRSREMNTVRKPHSMASPNAASQRARESAHLALRKYRPTFYHGRIRFVRAAISSVFPSNPARVWGRLADQLDVETAPGDHHGMVQTQFQALAAILSRYIQDATRR